MALFGLVAVFVMLFLVGVGFAVGLAGCALAACLIAMGVVSTSTFIGWRSKRAMAGFRAFAFQCGIIVGIPAGVTCAWIGGMLFELAGAGWQVLVCGAVGGAVAGLAVAWMLVFSMSRLQTWGSDRLRLSR